MCIIVHKFGTHLIQARTCKCVYGRRKFHTQNQFLYGVCLSYNAPKNTKSRHVSTAGSTFILIYIYVFVPLEYKMMDKSQILNSHKRNMHCAKAGRSRDRIPVASVTGIFLVDTDKTMCPGVDSASKNEYQGFLLG